jgi:hypothetical protein
MIERINYDFAYGAMIPVLYPSLGKVNKKEELNKTPTPRTERVQKVERAYNVGLDDFVAEYLNLKA